MSNPIVSVVSSLRDSHFEEGFAVRIRRPRGLLPAARRGGAALLLFAACARPATDPSQQAQPLSSSRDEAGGAVPATFRNPVIAGTSPDPSACRVGDDYYLVSSTFEYFPGVPISHSKDLVHWEQIGHVLSTRSQLPLEGTRSARGIFAPTLRYHEGTFYVITTNMDGGGSFYVTATDPRGPWSEPFWIRDAEFTMDPSLFFDDDGKVYYTRHGEGERGGIFQAEIDVATGELLAEPRKIWAGTGGVWPEGPHLYKRAGEYYLLIAEGGTSFGHRVTVARSESPWGPFESYPRNPLLTHMNLPEHPIQATGHADLVDTPDGHFWLVLLGVRPSTHRRHHTGRETFLAPLAWSEGGWPVVNRGQPIELAMSTENLPDWTPPPEPSARDEFDSPQLALRYKFVRNPDPASWSLTERPGFLRLRGTKRSLDDVASPALVVFAQADLRMRLATELHFRPEPGQRAGLAVRSNEANHYELLLESSGGERSVVLRTTVDGKKSLVGRVAHAGDRVRLVIEGYPDHYAFFLDQPDGFRVLLGSAPTTQFSYESARVFTGAHVGVYAQSDAGAPAVADFAWLEYEGLD